MRAVFCFDNYTKTIRMEKVNFYKVVALRCIGLKRVFKSGETVSENDFPKGHAEALVEQKFLKKLSKSVNDKLNKEYAEAKEVAQKEAKEAAEVAESKAKEDVKNRKSINESMRVLEKSRVESAKAAKADNAAKDAVNKAQKSKTELKNVYNKANGADKEDAQKQLDLAMKNLETAKSTQLQTAETLKLANEKVEKSKLAVEKLTNVGK